MLRAKTLPIRMTAPSALLITKEVSFRPRSLLPKGFYGTPGGVEWTAGELRGMLRCSLEHLFYHEQRFVRADIERRV